MSKYVEMTHDQVIDACKKYMDEKQVAFVEKAYKFAAKAHKARNALLASLILFTQLKLRVPWLSLASIPTR